MSEVKKNTEGEVKEKTTRKTAGEAPKKEAKPVKEKKDNFIKRGFRKVKNAMSEHPFISSAVSATIGGAITAGAGYGAKKVIERHRERNCIPPQDNPSSLDPNV